MFESNGNNEQTGNSATIIESKKVSILDQDTPHSARSEKYLLIKTRDVLDIFKELGFTYSEESLWSQKSRKTSRHGKGKHMVTLRHPDLQVAQELRNELVPQMYLWNSYDGSIKLKLIIGFWRFVCENQMALGSGIVEPIVFKHISSMENKESRKRELVSTIEKAAEKFKEMSNYVLSLKDVEMTREQKLSFARKMVEIRLAGKDKTLESKGIEVTDATLEEQILKPRRAEDVGNSAWLVANVVQESLLSPNNFSEFAYVKTSVNKKNETVRKDKKCRQLKDQVKISEINQSLFQVLNQVVSEESQVLLAA